jgi:EAL domain-containing protein (putative c-di-GMP-specific phosphodiesterase class I)
MNTYGVIATQKFHKKTYLRAIFAKAYTMRSAFYANIDRDPNAVVMVDTIVGLAKKLHIQTIAEFVASKEILSVVTDLGVDYAQGFHLGRPDYIENHIS